MTGQQRNNGEAVLSWIKGVWPILVALLMLATAYGTYCAQYQDLERRVTVLELRVERNTEEITKGLGTVSARLAAIEQQLTSVEKASQETRTDVREIRAILSDMQKERQ